MAEMVTLEGDQCERCRVLLCFILSFGFMAGGGRFILVMTQNPTSMLAPWLALINTSLQTAVEQCQCKSAGIWHGVFRKFKANPEFCNS